ncbi:TVP38/TMEM64 family protein [Prosthecobacter vanneervenii]|uniref:TVP38/TMEM64 family membrane protein n=1 Tax=Prosthecobacter vanneervenii TaxID=48466 RepID=A0A7W8DLB3_9BACT|nr:VTT domain-containing protein [Prosthecobacter vanneervenii]MBB5033860.1 putative membrane protein YdjX (TVP38/TMEM64 family) [Prosthecobacter vanneervenii]
MATHEDPAQEPEELLDAAVATEVEQETSRALGKETRQVLMAVLLVAAFMAVAHFTPLKAWISNVQTWKKMVHDFGWGAHAIFMAACAGSVMLGVPRLPLCAAAGLVFGFGEGLVISLVASTLGSYGAFVLSRHGFRRAAESRAEKWPWLKKLLKKPSVLRVFWVRQLMVPGLVLNVLLGMTPVKHTRFLLGTALGYLPLNVAFSLVGSGLGKGSLATTMTQLLAAMAVINIAAWLVYKVMKKQKQQG